MKRVLFVFTSGRKKRLLRKDVQTYPKEFLFGVPFLQQKGYVLDILELEELPFELKSVQYHLLFFVNWFVSLFTGVVSSWHLFHNSQHLLNDYDLILSCNEYVASGVAYLKCRKKIKGDHIFFVMGMLAKVALLKNKSRARYLFATSVYQKLIKGSEKIIFIGEGEYKYARKAFRGWRDKYRFIPFPVDNEFWSKKDQDYECLPYKNYVLFVGNDRQRDFECVVNIVMQMQETNFVIISKNSNFGCLHEYQNVTVISGDWKSQALSDVQIRSFYQHADLVIVPLKNTLQPSGQSVALQAMACGTPVMISKTDGFWEPSVFRRQQHLIFINSQGHDEWVQAISQFLGNKDELCKMSIQAQKLVGKNNSLETFGNKLVSVINEL